MNFSFLLVLEVLLVLGRLHSLLGVPRAHSRHAVPVLAAERPVRAAPGQGNATTAHFTRVPMHTRFLPLLALIDVSKDTSEFWRATDILALVQAHSADLDPEQCRAASASAVRVRFPATRTVRTICRGAVGNYTLPRCSHLDPEQCRAASASAVRVRFPATRTVRTICRGAVGNYTLPRCSHLDPEQCRAASASAVRVRFPATRTVRTICRGAVGNYTLPTLQPPRPEQCRAASASAVRVRFPATRSVRTICRGAVDRQLCPQCPHFTNYSECELFRDSCKERKVKMSERATYCDQKYGRWRAVLLPADYSACQCCDECVFYRELDQSCIADEYSFDVEEFLPTTTIDFRAGCNPYWGHSEQELRALRCDKILRRCVPMIAPAGPKDTLQVRRKFRYEPPSTKKDCPFTCRGYHCPGETVKESTCAAGAFLPDKETCNCCGKCSPFQQLNEKCAEFKKTVHNNNGSKEIEVEEEFLEPGCDDGLVCRQGRCQDIHSVAAAAPRRKRAPHHGHAREPCKTEMKLFKKKYGADGHLHYDAPQCTPLWLYAPVQCRRFVCYCALEDGTPVRGVRVPRVEVSSMNCDCAREKCRTGSDVECDGYGNYREAVFTTSKDDWPDAVPYEAADEPTKAPQPRSTPLTTTTSRPPTKTTAVPKNKRP